MDDTNSAHDDPMNIDDYIFPSSIASPAGISPSPPSEKAAASTTAMASAIPIKTKKTVQEQSHPEFPLLPRHKTVREAANLAMSSDGCARPALTRLGFVIH